MRSIAFRLAELLLVMFIVSLGVFLLVAMLPGDPAVSILGAGRPAAEYEALRVELGLRDPLWERYLDWLGGALGGDLGSSIIPPGQEVTKLIGQALPVSLQLAAMGLALALLFALPLAMASAARPGSAFDRAVGGIMFGILSVPSFLAGLLLIALLANTWGVVPRSRWVTPGEGLAANLHHAILPAVVIALMELALFTRVLRGDLIATLRENFVTASRARGTPPWRIMVNEALRPSSFSLVTLMGLSLGRLIGSTVIVEYLFSLPGMGSLVVSSARTGDFPVVQGAVLVIALIYVVTNMLIDISYGYIDPRTRRAHV